jgi:hypothetical protein
MLDVVSFYLTLYIGAALTGWLFWIWVVVTAIGLYVAFVNENLYEFRQACSIGWWSLVAILAVPIVVPLVIIVGLGYSLLAYIDHVYVRKTTTHKKIGETIKAYFAQIDAEVEQNNKNKK